MSAAALPVPPSGITFPTFLLKRGLSLGSTSNYSAAVGKLVRIGGSPGWGEKETPEAVRARRVHARSLTSYAVHRAGWNWWKLFVEKEFEVTILPLDASATPAQYPAELLAQVRRLVDVVGARRAIALRWGDVDFESGLATDPQGVVIPATVASQVQRGPRYLGGVFEMLRDAFQPKSGEECVLVFDREDPELAMKQNQLRALLAAEKNASRLRQSPGHGRPVGAKILVTDAATGLTPDAAKVQAPTISLTTPPDMSGGPVEDDGYVPAEGVDSVTAALDAEFNAMAQPGVPVPPAPAPAPAKKTKKASKDTKPATIQELEAAMGEKLPAERRAALVAEGVIDEEAPAPA